MELPSATRRVVAAAKDHGLTVDIHLFPDGTKTSADAAAAVGCDLAAIAKSLVFMADDQPVVCLVSGDRRVDPARLAEAMGASRARRATLDEARVATGFAAGGTPPFGYPQPLPVLADPHLGRNDEVWSAGGTPTTVFPIAIDDLIRASNARVIDVTQG